MIGKIALKILIAWFDKAAMSGLQAPKVRFPERDMRLSRTSRGSREPGSVVVTSNDGASAGGEYYGRISREGVFVLPSGSDEIDPRAEELLAELLEDPTGTVARAGARVGSCSFCGHDLTTDESLTVGYGPICAERYGMPWGEEEAGESDPTNFGTELAGDLLTEEEIEEAKEELSGLAGEGTSGKEAPEEEKEKIRSVISEVAQEEEEETGPSREEEGASGEPGEKDRLEGKSLQVETESPKEHPEGEFALRFPYDKALVAEAKEISGREWNSETKTNRYPFDIFAARQLDEFLNENEEALAETEAGRGLGGEPLLVTDAAREKLDAILANPKEYAEYPDSIDEDGNPKPFYDRQLRVGRGPKGKEFVAEADFDKELVGIMRSLAGRRFEREDKTDRFPLSEAGAASARALIEKHEFTPTGEVLSEIERLTPSLGIGKEEAMERLSELGQGFGGELRDFQREAVEYALRKEGRALIGDDMGLGKTIEALAAVHAAEAYPAAIVCPASVKINWRREAEKWLPEEKSVRVLSGREGEPSEADVTVINYDILKDRLGNKSFPSGLGAVVLDESHYAKNRDAQRTQAAKELAGRAQMRIFLTGTPVKSRPFELTEQLKGLGCLHKFGGFWPFAKRYCNARRNGFGWDFSGAANLEELNDRLREHCYIRRTKKEVLPQLGEKERVTVPFEIDNRSDYETCRRNLVKWLRSEERRKRLKKRAQRKEREGRSGELTEAEEKALSGESGSGATGGAEHLVRIGELKKLAARGKLEGVIEWAQRFTERGEKLVIFAHHRDIVTAIAEALEEKLSGEENGEAEIPRVIGGQSSSERQDAIDAFTRGDAPAIVLNMQAGGTGVDGLQKVASSVAFCELGWTPSEHNQAEDRLQRIGQEGSVTCYYLLAENTIEEDIAALIEEKREVVEKTMDGETSAAAAGEASKNILAGLLDSDALSPNGESSSDEEPSPKPVPAAGAGAG